MLSSKKLTSLVLAGLMSATIGLGVSAQDSATVDTKAEGAKLEKQTQDILKEPFKDDAQKKAEKELAKNEAALKKTEDNLKTNKDKYDDATKKAVELQIKWKKGVIAEQKAKIESANNRIAEKIDDIFLGLNKDVEEKEAEIKAVDTEISKREAELKSMKEKYEKRKDKYDDATKKIAEKAIAMKDSALTSQKDKLAQKKTELKSIRENALGNLGNALNKADELTKEAEKDPHAEAAKRYGIDLLNEVSVDTVRALQGVDANKAAIAENKKAIDLNAAKIASLDVDAQKGIAKATALAGLHPIDMQDGDKLSFAVSAGTYKDETAIAAGAFYRPNRNMLLSFASTLENEDQAYNVGLSFKFGKEGKVEEKTADIEQLYKLIGELQAKLAQQQVEIDALRK